jgi:hypothetical protein
LFKFQGRGLLAIAAAQALPFFMVHTTTGSVPSLKAFKNKS